MSSPTENQSFPNPAPEQPPGHTSAGGGSATELIVPASLNGARVDKAIGTLAKLSRATAKALFEGAAGVRVNGRRAAKGAVVQTGDVIILATAPTANTSPGERSLGAALADPNVVLDVRLERPDIVVVYKPPKMATAPLSPDELGTLANGIVAQYPETAQIGDVREPGLVHRLDNDTSGLLLVARSQAAYKELRAAIRNGLIEKRYLAIVAPGAGSARASSVAASGIIPDSGTVEFPIAPHPKDRRRVFACVHPRDVQRLSPRDARTTYRVLQRWEAGREEAFAEDGSKPIARALVEASAPRAVRHQVRVHLAALGAPLVGDGLYGGPPSTALGRHALHASRISYVGGAVVSGFTVDIPLADDMKRLVPNEG